jgi:hypothetical protein
MRKGGELKLLGYMLGGSAGLYCKSCYLVGGGGGGHRRLCGGGGWRLRCKKIQPLSVTPKDLPDQTLNRGCKVFTEASSDTVHHRSKDEALTTDPREAKYQNQGRI